MGRNSLDIGPCASAFVRACVRAFGFVRLIVLVFGFAVTTHAAEITSSAGPGWITDYQQGLDQAQKDKKPVLLDLYADWCGPCRMMDEQTYRDPRVVKVMSEFVCIKLNVDEQQRAAFAYRVEGIPRVIALNIYGEGIGDIVGFTDADMFLFFLEDAKANAKKHVQGAIVNVPGEDISGGGAETVITAETEMSTLLELLSNAKPTTRAKAREECVRRNTPEIRAALVEALLNDYLGTRIAAWETLTKLDANLNAQFDPWASKAERDGVAASIR